MKKSKPTIFNFILILIVFAITTGCASLDQGWQSAKETNNSVDSETHLSSIQKLELSAETKEEVVQLIEEYKTLLKSDYNYSTLSKIGNYYMLMGAGYSDKKKDKKENYKHAIEYCEKAMLTCNEFNMAMSDNKDITANYKHLTINEIDAMGYWYTTRFYYFKECLSPLGRLFNTGIVRDNNMLIKQIDQLDSTWSGGGNYFARGIYYISTPEKFGGSLERAETEFSKAIEIGPEYLSNRWGRAKYLYSLTGNAKGYISDLEWVIEQNPHNSSIPYSWNVYFQNDAKKMLENKE